VGRKDQSTHGEISPFNALMTALAADIGTGNIVGVSTAIYIGGPGALFWMWMTALVGMATKFCEVLLSVHFREKTPAGNWVGGAMYFIKNGLGPKWVWLGTCFALFGITACIGTGAMVQSNSIGEAVSATFAVPTWITAIVLLVLVGLVLVGGVARIGAVAGKIVPLMAVVYTVIALIVIVMNFSQVPAVFANVIYEAFTPTAAQGGFAGATVMMAIRMGMARGVFSNEAGLGTAPMAHAAATVASPLTQASIGMLDTFIDTILVCSMTGFAILVTGQWTTGQTGAAMTTAAFEGVLPGVGAIAVTLCLALFAFTTTLGWCVYGERCAIYLMGDKAQ
ncbi:MAG: amino acid carrier protein, partial [Bilophila sp.]